MGPRLQVRPVERLPSQGEDLAGERLLALPAVFFQLGQLLSRALPAGRAGDRRENHLNSSIVHSRLPMLDSASAPATAACAPASEVKLRHAPWVVRCKVARRHAPGDCWKAGRYSSDGVSRRGRTPE